MFKYKLYSITRNDLTHGQQAAQAAHAISAYAYEYPHLHNRWFEDSRYIVLLTIETKDDLAALAEELEQKGIHVSRFHEPDWDDELTAIAAVGPIVSSHCSHLPLACK